MISCQIGFYYPKTELNKPVALIYRHLSGTPAEVISDIKPILEDFDKNRGLSDVEYAAAWLVAKLKTDYMDIGITNIIYEDIEYYYAVYPNKIEVYDAPGASASSSFETLKLKETILMKR